MHTIIRAWNNTLSSSRVTYCTLLNMQSYKPQYSTGWFCGVSTMGTIDPTGSIIHPLLYTLFPHQQLSAKCELTQSIFPINQLVQTMHFTQTFFWNFIRIIFTVSISRLYFTDVNNTSINPIIMKINLVEFSQLTYWFLRICTNFTFSSKLRENFYLLIYFTLCYFLPRLEFIGVETGVLRRASWEKIRMESMRASAGESCSILGFRRRWAACKEKSKDAQVSNDGKWRSLNCQKYHRQGIFLHREEQSKKKKRKEKPTGESGGRDLMYSKMMSCGSILVRTISSSLICKQSKQIIWRTDKIPPLQFDVKNIQQYFSSNAESF